MNFALLNFKKMDSSLLVEVMTTKLLFMIFEIVKNLFLFWIIILQLY